MPRIWTTVFLVAVFGAAGFGLGACRSSPSPEPAVSVAGKSDSELLFDAAVVSFRKRDLEVDHASKKHRVVASTYQRVSERLRRRFMARIIRLPGGANGLRVRVEHERRFGDGDGAVWKSVESRQLRERAKEAELELARAIEKRYRRWRSYREEHGEQADAGGGESAGAPDGGPVPRESDPPAAKPSFGPGR